MGKEDDAQSGDLVRVTVDGWRIAKGTEFIACPYGVDSNGHSFIYEPRMEFCVAYGSYEILERVTPPQANVLYVQQAFGKLNPNDQTGVSVKDIDDWVARIIILKNQV